MNSHGFPSLDIRAPVMGRWMDGWMVLGEVPAKKNGRRRWGFLEEVLLIDNGESP
jgi:hypothetical protein